MATTSVPSVPVSPFARLSRLATGSKADDKDEKDPTDKNDAVDDGDDDDDEEDGADESGKKKKSKKVKKAEDDSDDEDEEKPEARSARLREKARIATILHSAAGQRLPGAALQLALESSMPRHAAVKLLASMSGNVPQSRDGLRDRMAGVDVPDLGAGDAQQPAAGVQGTAAAIIAAGKKRRGEG
jgi:hypothetical protein